MPLLPPPPFRVESAPPLRVGPNPSIAEQAEPGVSPRLRVEEAERQATGGVRIEVPIP